MSRTAPGLRPHMAPLALIRAVTANDLPAILDLNARAFGPGRFTRTAYRVREGTPDMSRFCLTAAIGSEIVAAIRFTEIMIGGRTGALLLGPLAVEPAFAGQGLGRRLIAQGLENAKAAGLKLVVLIGDLPYYGRVGFKCVPVGQINLPGPFDPHRLLAAELQEGALATYSGMIAADRS